MIKYTILFLTALVACQSQVEQADMIIYNGHFTTMAHSDVPPEAMAIAGDRILAIGRSGDIEPYRNDSTKMLNAQGHFIYPGLIEGHGHLADIGSSLQDLDLSEALSWQEVVAAVKSEVDTLPPGSWIIGRGWHQEKWNITPQPNLRGYPYHHDLSAISPQHPVLLFHASGHAAFANRAAMDDAGVSLETTDPAGGSIVRDARGDAIGVFEEVAQGVIHQAHIEFLNTLAPEQRMAKWHDGILLAIEECLSKGITTFYDAGSSLEVINRYQDLAEQGELDLRLWVMIRHSSEELEGNLGTFPWIGLSDHHLTVRAIKTALDGALGSFGAWMLEPYADKPGFFGQNTVPTSEVDRLAQMALEYDLQLCVHAIGDRANQETLDIFERYYRLAPPPADLRWRIEHAQHLDPSDIPRFREIGVIASMQGIHCTSDAPFVETRLGYQRAKTGAYPWRSLLASGAVIANGTDAPVEDVDPITSFYASVTRVHPGRKGAFFPEQAMTRAEALRSYTIDAAYAGFEEHLKGSLEVGKLADVTILDKDLLRCPDEEILQTRVMYTIVGGEIKYQLDE